MVKTRGFPVDFPLNQSQELEFRRHVAFSSALLLEEVSAKA